MSKSSTASASKIPTQLPSKSAWAKGPPQSNSSAPSPRSQSPAPNQGAPQPTHSRRPSALGQGVSFKDGVAGARSPTSAVKSASSVTFGSIDDITAPISSSPAAVPIIKSEGVKTFGSVPATPTSASANGKPTSAASGPPLSQPPVTPSTPSKFDIKKLFQVPSSAPVPTSAASQSSASPSSRTSSLPQSSPQISHSQPSQLGAHSYPFVPSGGPRPPQNGSQPTSGAPPPRSPVFPRQMPNGQVNGVNGRPGGAPGGPGAGPGAIPAGMSSPRMGPPHLGQPTGMPPQVPVPGWPGYYYPPQYPGMPPPEAYIPYSPGWHVPQHMVPPPHQQAPGPPGPQHGGMPMSPRNVPPPLHTPGTPTLAPAMPNTAHPPHTTPSPHSHNASLSSVSSPPPTPSSSTSAPGMNRLNSGASAFVPRKTHPVKITTTNGMEVNLESYKKQGVTPSPTVPSSPARKSMVRMETPEAKERRLAEEKEKERQKKDAEERVKREEEERKKKVREEEERKKAAEEERVRKEKEDEERARKQRIEEEERVRKQKVEEEARLKKEEEERIQKEEEERARKEEEERIAREEAEKAEKAKAALEELEESEPQQAEAEEGEVEEPDEIQPALPETPEVTDDSKEKSVEKNSLRIDTAVSVPDLQRRRHPGPLDLSSAKSQPVPQPLPSALATARVIEDINSVSYPEGIRSPKVELNVNARHGKFRYDRDFLMQFMAICKEKPESLPPLDAIGLEPVDQPFPMSRGGSGRRASAAMPPPASTSRSGVGLGISGFNKPGSNPFQMGQFATPTTKMSSEERFAISSSSRSTSMSGGTAGIPFNRAQPLTRTSSQGGPMANKRTRSKRGVDRADANKAYAGPSGSSFDTSAASQAGMAPFEPVAPLEISANRWQPTSLGKRPQQADTDSPEIVDRKVKGLLNKLTMERFDSISDQIIAWANRSEKEKDGRTLIQVIRLVFEKATDEATWSEMYARLCRKMMEQISPKVQDDGIKNTEGKPIAGGQLFRKYLLNRCQEDFERGWVAKEATAAAAATRASEDQAAKAAAEKDADENILYSEEYYAAQKAKRQGLGLIKFIGELFKLQMLTERIMHECVKKLLGNVENPEEEEIESLCKLLTTVGQILDTQKARAHMDVYFSRMKELTKSLNDVIELRERKWIPRNQVAAPTTIAAVHEAAAKEKAAHEKDAYQRNLSMSRGGSRRGGDRGDHTQIGPDGWAVAGGSVPRPPPKAGDLSNFGKISKPTSMTLGPASVFQGKEKTKSRESTISRGGSSNMFSKLMENPELATEVASSKSSRPPSRKASVDFGASGMPEAPQQRRKLQLLPRSVPKADEIKADSTPASEAGQSDDEGGDPAAPSMTEDEALTRVKEDSKEFFSIRDLTEAEVYFSKLPSEHRWRLVDKLVSSAIESKESDAQLVADFFSRAMSKNLCSPQSFEDGFAPVAEILDDVAIDAPKAFNLMAMMMKGARLDQDEDRRSRLASKSMDSDKLLALLS
ncbi:uncharacterized protein FIBRA_06068 [Fibroporia radiculosa]|uniref:MI domain-containing protein n=1 Tax=Fibroporia radiculosa TaxID=599839 RepID=J4HYJ5_9APHY|nr:uncharacterized protein FIBRA_06068 [Fibroporia radiculosa]CCM03917.1 predicted protein [Fibroporia radiculosa]